MATRSTIAIEFADGSVSQIYCHWDGYLDNNGMILNNYYTDPFKVQKLIDNGSISSLRETVEDSIDNSGDPWPAERYMNVDEYFDCSRQEEYDYLLRNVDGKPVWFVRCYVTNGVWEEMGVAYEMVQEETA